MQLGALEKFINRNHCKIVVIIIPSQTLSSCECIVYFSHWHPSRDEHPASRLGGELNTVNFRK